MENLAMKEKFLKQIASGQPTKYDKEKHIELLFDIFSKGEGVMAFCAETLISERTFYKWLHSHKEFEEAYKGVISIAGRQWEAYPLKKDPSFNFPYWSTIMRNRFGYGRPRVQVMKDASSRDRLTSVWKGLEEVALTTNEAIQITSLANIENNIKTSVAVNSYDNNDVPRTEEERKAEIDLITKGVALKEPFEKKQE